MVRKYIDIIAEASQDVTSSPAFRAWFRDSKVVDVQGHPLVVYHGGSSEITSFDATKVGQNFGVDKEGFFFTTNVAHDVVSMGGGGREVYNDMFSAGAYAKNVGGAVYPCYLRIENPLTFQDWCHMVGLDPDYEIDNHGHPQQLLDIYKKDIIRFARDDGNDGIIFAHGNDDVFVVFEPTQIKSAFNRKFNGDHPDILESYYDDDPWGGEDDAPALDSYSLPRGTVLYHGTNGDFEEEHGLNGPVWVSNSEKVAEYFAGWRGDNGEARVTKWETTQEIELGVLTTEYLEYAAEYLGIELDPSEPDDMLQHLRQKGFAGWVIPDNYGYREADICLEYTDDLQYIDSRKL